MIVIYGTRFYGQVDHHAGQHQLTKFFHIYYVPLVPVGPGAPTPLPGGTNGTNTTGRGRGGL